MLYDVVIAGAGAAGLTAAMYAKRAGLSVLVLERMFVGGQAATTYEIENYPGVLDTSGPELMQKFEAHAKKFGAEIVPAEIAELNLDGDTKKIHTTAGAFEGKTLIIATGAKPRLLGIPGEARLTGRGCSYCATCDGSFYRKKITAVVGGGNTAVEDAIFLSRLCEKVYLIHRRNSFRADRSLTRKLDEIPNIELRLGCVPNEIIGVDFVTGIEISPASGGGSETLTVDGIFVAVGTVPDATLYKGKLETDSQGYIITDSRMAASAPGVFAAGDIRNTPLRQVVTAAADGAVAAYSASAYLAEL